MLVGKVIRSTFRDFVVLTPSQHSHYIRSGWVCQPFLKNFFRAGPQLAPTNSAVKKCRRIYGGSPFLGGHSFERASEEGGLRVACFFTRPFPRGLCPPSEPPPFRHWASAFALGAAGPHLSHLLVTPRLVTSYTAPLGSVRLVHRGWSYGLTRVSPDLGFASPHPVPVLYHSRSGLSRVF